MTLTKKIAMSDWNAYLQELLDDLVDFVGRAKLVRALDREEAQELLIRAKVAEENNDGTGPTS